MNKNKHYVFLVAIWLIVSIINLQKAFHIDDTFHIESAKHILENPLRPMSGLVNWDQDLTPFYSHNQPPLFFFIMAGWASVFGFSELSFHLLISIFSFFCLFFFLKILQKIQAKSQISLLFFFGFNVGFIVNQNVMVDVPLLMVILGFTYYLISEENSNYFIASLFLTVGLLIKYTILPLIVVYSLIVILRKEKEKLIYLLIPTFFLLLWSLWNYIEFRGFHISSRSGFSLTLNSIYSYISTLGSVSIFAFLFIYFFPGKIFKSLYYFVLASVLVLPLLAFFNFLSLKLINSFLQYVFLSLGLMLLYTVSKMLYVDYKSFFAKNTHCNYKPLIYLILGGLGIFILGWAPFYATRHLILLIPFVLLLLDDYVTRMSAFSKATLLSVFVLANLLSSFSDVRFSNYYRTMAEEIPVPDSINVWTSGHWGWQYYSTMNGMKQYHFSTSDPKEGDYFIFPAKVPRQNLNPKYMLEVIEKRWIDPSNLDFLFVNGQGNLYNSKFKEPSVIFSRQPVDTIIIARIRVRNTE